MLDEIKNIVVHGTRPILLDKEIQYCPLINNCYLDHNKSNWESASLVILTDGQVPIGKRPANQPWMIIIHEAPPHIHIDLLKNMINYTSTYRMDSTIPSTYGTFFPFDTTLEIRKIQKNYAIKKSKKIAWLVSNCEPWSPRDVYANELMKHIQVDVFGKCNKKKCYNSMKNCLNMLKQAYKFYLSFENCLAQDYITEKTYSNALKNNLLPIIMGASLGEIKHILPSHSFIHVDQFESPADLAKYLHYLDQNDSAYNEYFAWKAHKTIQDWISVPGCDYCLLANFYQFLKPTWYEDISSWWNKGTQQRTLRWKAMSNKNPN